MKNHSNLWWSFACIAATLGAFFFFPLSIALGYGILNVVFAVLGTPYETTKTNPLLFLVLPIIMWIIIGGIILGYWSASGKTEYQMESARATAMVYPLFVLTHGWIRHFRFCRRNSLVK